MLIDAHMFKPDPDTVCRLVPFDDNHSGALVRQTLKSPLQASLLLHAHTLTPLSTLSHSSSLEKSP